MKYILNLDHYFNLREKLNQQNIMILSFCVLHCPRPNVLLIGAPMEINAIGFNNNYCYYYNSFPVDELNVSCSIKLC